MNRYLKSFLLRGMLFGGFGPLILGVIFCILQHTTDSFSIDGDTVLLGVASTYLLAFLHAGASVFNQIEHWSPARSLFCHFLTLYITYVGCYLLNSWIPLHPLAIAFFTAGFALVYVLVWLIVVASIKATQKRINAKLKANRP